MASERRYATIMFADISGFTAAAEKLDPEELTDIVNGCFAVMEAAVREHGGYIDKYIGDCLMATFGAPTALESAARRAVNAAIEIRNRLEQLRRERRLAIPVEVHVGINSGLVLTGAVGGEVRREVTVMGDAVNVAARLKDAATRGAIWVGAQTYYPTRDDFEYRRLPPLSAKGKEQALDVYEVLAREPRIYRTPPSAARGGISSELVGRARELERIEGRLHQLLDGEGGVIAVLGEAGIGKSRLIAEATTLETARATHLLEGRSLAIGGSLSLHPFVDLLRRWAGIGEGDSDDEALPKLERSVRDLMPDVLEDTLPFIATLMGIRLTGAHEARMRGIEGEALEDLLFQKVRLLFQRLAEAHPLVVVFEDLHWADQSSIKLLESLLRVAARHRILLVVVGRPDFPETLERVIRLAREQLPDRYLELGLARLSDQESHSLIGNLLGGGTLPYPTEALIVRTAEGNPFFIEEVVRALIDEGAVVRRDQRYRLTEKIKSVVIPGTIQEVIMARVDRLDAPARHVLQVASVIGRFFQHSVLADIVGDAAELDLHLRTLVDRQLVIARQSRRTATHRRATMAAEREYVFKHALLQETIYESILLKTRRELHGRVAESIETLFADRLVDFYPMLAYHFSSADQPARAEEYLFRAGEEAARSAASNEALLFFREASRLYLSLHGEGGDPRKKALLEKNIALALLNKGSLTESIEHFDRALEHLGVRTSRGSLARYAAFARDLADVARQLYLFPGRRRRVADWTAEREVFQIILNRGRAEITSDPTRLLFDSVAAFRRLNGVDATQIDQASAVYASAGAVFCYSGLSFSISRRAIALAKGLVRPGSVRDQFTCASMEFIQNYLAGDWDDAFVVEEGLVEDALRFGQLWDVNTYLGLYCDRRLRQGDFAGARTLLGRLADLNDAYGYAFAGANHDVTLALLLLEQRRVRDALHAIEPYVAARHEDPLKVLGYGTRAKIQLLLGDGEAAAESLLAAERITSRSREIPPWHLSAYAAARLRFDLHALEAGDGGRSPAALGRRARASARYALGIAARAALQRTEVRQLAGRLWWLLGSRRRAIAHWRESLRVGMQLGARPELARTYAEIGRSIEQGGDSALAIDGVDAEGCFERAAALFGEVGLPLDVGLARSVGRAAA
jgi:class 3 adenylate cyclase/tetratricopeptide (TPR) repeat protein